MTDTPLRDMLYPSVGLLSGNDALRQPTAPVTAQSLRAEEKEDHPHPMQHRFDRATTTQPSNRDLAVAHQFEPAKNVWDWVPFSTSWQNRCEKEAAAHQEKFDAEENGKEAEKVQKSLEGLRLNGKDGRPGMKRE